MLALAEVRDEEFVMNAGCDPKSSPYISTLLKVCNLSS